MNNNILHKLFLTLTLVLLTLGASAQVTISGNVSDESGEPIIGATVMEALTTNGVVTDFDGNFKIQVKNENATLKISYIGMVAQNIRVGNQRNIKVVLKDESQKINEVVVVGYGHQKKESVVGAISQVSSDDLLNTPTANVTQAIAGKIPGVVTTQVSGAPGADDATINIRGRATFAGDGAPLVMVDGVERAFSQVAPDDIESISVLKDASAAVYGARAANGVILVTTKKGKMGAPRISYSGSFGFTDEVSRPKMLNAYQYGRLYNAVTAADPTNTSLNKTTALFQADELEAMKGLNYDLLDKYWETGMTQKHSVNVSGATDKVNYFAGISYFDQDGNLGKLNYNRWNYRAGVDVKVSKWLGANLTVSGDYATKEKPLVKVGGSGDEKDYNLLLTRPTYMPESVNGYDLLAYGPSNTQKNQNQQYNFATLQNNGDYRKNMNSNLNISGSLDYDFGWSKILKGLKLRFSYSKSINTDKGNEYGSNFTLYQMLTRYGSGNHLYTPTSGDNADFDYLAASNFNGVTTANGDYLARTMVRTDNYQMNFTAQYQRDCGQHHLGGWG